MTAAVRTNLLDLTPAEAESALRAFAESQGVAAYRGGQAARHLWGAAPAATFDKMSDLPKSFRALLSARFDMPRLLLAEEQQSSDGTRKFLLRLHDGQAIETVAIPDGDRLTFCVSSQAGCALQCSFCATGAMGFARNLAPHEIAGQVRELAMLSPPVVATNIVFMGMGEPLMNWQSVDVALTILNDPRGFGIGARHITVSTVGWLPGIEALAARKEQFRLAISVHAPTDALRATLMPVNTKYPAGRRDRRGGDVRPARDVRVRDARRRERHAGERDGTRGARAALQGVREPDPAASRRRDGIHAVVARGHRGVRAAAARARSGGGDPQEPRRGHRGGVRPATGRAAPAAASSSGRLGR